MDILDEILIAQHAATGATQLRLGDSKWRALVDRLGSTAHEGDVTQCRRIYGLVIRRVPSEPDLLEVR